MLAAGLALAASGPASAQSISQIDWRPIGGTSLEAGLAAPATGPVSEVWYSIDGAALYARTPSGRVFETRDFERWDRSAASGGAVQASALSAPEPGARVYAPATVSARRYALGAAVYRSDDEGRTWRDMSRFRGRSILGGGLTSLAVSPLDPDEVTIAARTGVWRSLDGGITWSGLNDELPNLPVRKILAVRPVRIAIEGAEAVQRGGRRAWQLIAAEQSLAEERLRVRVGTLAGFAATQAIAQGDQIYAAGAGRIASSPDGGRTWRTLPSADNSVATAIFAARTLPTSALAAVTLGDGARLLRTTNGGIFWDDVTANLSAARIGGVAADVETGSIYAATDQGLFVTYGDLRAAAPATPWRRVDLPASAQAAALDVRLDDAGNQIYVAIEGYGVFAAMAPHRLRAPKVVNAADRTERAAAPGALLSVLGRGVATVKAGDLDVPVLAASPGETQIQVPFEATGPTLSLALGAGEARSNLTMPLVDVSPAIFLDRDGVPMILDADTGTLLEPGRAARAGSRIQILATGLGRVTPNWPTGLAAPQTNPPRVIAPVRVLLDRSPVEVTRATLAPGFAGFYLVEVQIPDVVNVGPAELIIESNSQRSTAVSIQLAQ